MRSTLPIALALVPLAASAGTLELGKPVSGSWAASPQTVPYTAHLPAGGLAVRFTASWCGTVDLVGGGGHVLQRLRFAPLDEDVDGGEMRVPATGDYRVRATGTRCADGLPSSGTYELALQRDCLGTSATTCTLPLGQTLAGARNFNGDRDWYAVRLVAGRRYDLETRGPAAFLSLYDGRGRDLADGTQQPPDCTGDGCRYVIAGYTPPRTGTYYAGADPRGGSYTVRLSR